MKESFWFWCPSNLYDGYEDCKLSLALGTRNCSKDIHTQLKLVEKCSPTFCNVLCFFFAFSLSLSLSQQKTFRNFRKVDCAFCIFAAWKRKAGKNIWALAERKEKRWNGKVPELGRKNCVKTLYFADDDGMLEVEDGVVHHTEMKNDGNSEH